MSAKVGGVWAKKGGVWAKKAGVLLALCPTQQAADSPWQPRGKSNYLATQLPQKYELDTPLIKSKEAHEIKEVVVRGAEGRQAQEEPSSE